jgi:glycosyltransferase involved in cell wall biosynthesis
MRALAGERFCFFFNGGATLRKGVDLLIDAFTREFGPSEEVCLIIKGSKVYGGDLGDTIEKVSRRSDCARIFYRTDEIASGDLPGLYTACDCYVHPYRSEGYGLPIAEAMACGRPVIVTGAGAARDFTDETTAFLIKCALERLSTRSVGGLSTVANPFWILPDINDLQRLMRHVFENRGAAKQKGERARESIRRHHTWKQAVAAAQERLLALAAGSR